MPDSPADYQDFYAGIDRRNVYTKDHPDAFERELQAFLDQHDLRRGKLLEIGSGRGVFQDVVPNYTGMDIAESLRSFYRRPEQFVVAVDGRPFPFPDHAFDGAFTYATFEHIPSLENALEELLRVVRPGGFILFHAAWQVRPWASRGLSVRPFRDLSLRDRLEKLTVPIRNNVLWRSLTVFPARFFRTLRFCLKKNRREWRIDYRPLDANYQVFWQSDSDACNHIDIHAAILWFQSRGCQVEEYPTLLSGFFARTGSFVVRVPKP
ncbi:MAG: class I SAM-dependent methyltransferase [Planctomycetota bacterium]